MMNFILLIVLPMLFFGAVIAIFMYCTHYLISYAKDAMAQALNSKNAPSDPVSEDE